MNKLIVASALAFAVLSPAKANIYYVDLSTITPIGVLNPPCYCGNGPLYPAMAAQPGDVFDFGSVTLYQTSDLHNGRMPNQWDIYNPVVAVSYDPAKQAYATGFVDFYFGHPPNPPPLRTYTVDLEFVVPDNAYSIQIGWTGRGDYLAAAVPEPSTWAMMILGFLGIAGMTRNKWIRNAGRN